MAQAVPFIIAAIGAAGSIRQGNVAKSAADYNAQVAEQRAELSLKQGTLQQEDQRKRAREAIGQQLAAVSESGTGLNGSNLDLLGDSLYNAELDRLNIRYQSELNSSGLQGQAQLDRFQGSNARTAGYLNAAASIGKAFSSYTSAGGSLNFGGGGGMTVDSGGYGITPGSVYSPVRGGN